MARKKKIPIPPQPPKADVKEGDVVRLVLDYHIATHQKSSSGLLKLWNNINGGIGEVVRVVSDEEVWVKGRKTQLERRFTADTIEKLSIIC